MLASKSANRKLYLDFLRIIAILFVIYNHTNERGYYLYAFECPFYLKLLYIATAGVISVAVPIFLMISGSLLIPKQESLKDLYLKRVLRMVIVLVVFSVIQYAYWIIFEGEQLSLHFFLYYTVVGAMTPSYWYLYAYLAYLIALPLIRKLALNMSNRDFIYIFIIYFVVECVFKTLVFFSGLGEMNGFFDIPFLDKIIIYPLLGYYLEHRLGSEKYNSKGTLICIGVIVVSEVMIIIMTLHRNLPFEEFTVYDTGLYAGGFTFCLAFAIFYLVKQIFKNCDANKHKVLSWIITTLGGCTFGVYLIEVMVRGQTGWIYDKIEPIFGKYPSAWLWCISVFLIAAVIIYILRLIPGVKKIL